MSDAPLILNVDDYDSARYARGKLLQQAGFRVVDAATGAEAVRLLTGELPAVALIDVQLPDMNGSDLCRRIKENPATASVLVVHTSATFRRGEDRVRGLEQGADAYLVEPVEPEVDRRRARSGCRSCAEPGCRSSSSQAVEGPMTTSGAYAEVRASTACARSPGARSTGWPPARAPR